MSQIRQVNSRNQLTLPPKAMREAGVRPGDYVEVMGEKGKIVLRPKELSDKGLSTEDWDNLARLVRRQLATSDVREYDSVEKARRHLRRLSK